MKRPHFALPEIYDDSLSYYDVLRKLIKSMNVISDNLNKIPEQIANEAKARLLGDQNLQQNINSEATTREQVDTTLQQNINAETSAREQADQEIREGVSDKISELKSELANKLPKSPTNWGPWTADEQAMARVRIGIKTVYATPIIDIRLEEETSLIEFDVDNLSSFIIEVFQPEDVALKKDFYVYIGAFFENSYQQLSDAMDMVASADNSNRAMYSLSTINGVCFGYWVVSPSGYMTNHNIRFLNKTLIVQEKTINKIRLYNVVPGKDLPKGTRILIYGA